MSDGKALFHAMATRLRPAGPSRRCNALGRAVCNAQPDRTFGPAHQRDAEVFARPTGAGDDSREVARDHRRRQGKRCEPLAGSLSLVVEPRLASARVRGHSTKAASSNDNILIGLGVKPQPTDASKPSGGITADKNNRILATMGGTSVLPRPPTNPALAPTPSYTYTPPPAARTNLKALYWLAAAIVLIVLVANWKTPSRPPSVSSPH